MDEDVRRKPKTHALARNLHTYMQTVLPWIRSLDRIAPCLCLFVPLGEKGKRVRRESLCEKQVVVQIGLALSGFGPAVGFL